MRLKPIRAINPKRPIPKGWEPVIETDEKGQRVTVGYKSPGSKRKKS